jgi:hypothetical protein
LILASQVLLVLKSNSNSSSVPFWLVARRRFYLVEASRLRVKGRDSLQPRIDNENDDDDEDDWGKGAVSPPPEKTTPEDPRWGSLWRFLFVQEVCALF